jgi:hypothetical protein
MKRFRTTPILWAALALVALPVLASGAPAAESAALQAFPAIAASESSQTPADQSVVVDLPAGIQAGDRLLALVTAGETGPPASRNCSTRQRARGTAGRSGLRPA